MVILENKQTFTALHRSGMIWLIAEGRPSLQRIVA
jgi:hypothetical protein